MDSSSLKCPGPESRTGRSPGRRQEAGPAPAHSARPVPLQPGILTEGLGFLGRARPGRQPGDSPARGGGPKAVITRNIVLCQSLGNSALAPSCSHRTRAGTRTALSPPLQARLSPSPPGPCCVSTSSAGPAIVVGGCPEWAVEAAEAQVQVWLWSGREAGLLLGRSGGQGRAGQGHPGAGPPSTPVLFLGIKVGSQQGVGAPSGVTEVSVLPPGDPPQKTLLDTQAQAW